MAYSFWTLERLVGLDGMNSPHIQPLSKEKVVVESLTVLWRVVAQQSRLSLALVGIGIDILCKVTDVDDPFMSSYSTSACRFLGITTT
ncbi:hypothetical protein EYF80_012986 [Liparis tanakae]|uniref:Uncharacterized protein n=1 Tax=Liparis tanakae TaxID=230148 RepID=A0A4Z2IG21_9TELE|nr:hypothetical protein EYF80_012986 [Liparis tanakae]